MSEQTMRATDPIQVMRDASAAFGAVLENVSPDQMSLPTVNDEWDVRALLNHIVNGNRWAEEMLRTGTAPRPSDDAFGDLPPMEVYRESVDMMLAAFEEPGALERTVTLPFGEIPGSAYAGLRSGDLVAHAWDLARATGQDSNIAPDICEMALGMARQRLDGRDRSQLPFKDEVITAADACPADRLAAYLGKQVA